MSDNLYAPPQADLGASAPPALGSGDFDFGRCFSDAWANTWAHFPLWLGVGVVALLAMAGSVLTVVGILLALPILYWGGFLFTLRMHDGGPAMGNLFAGFSRYGQVLGPTLGLFLLNIVLGIPANVLVQMGTAQESFALIGVGYLLSIAVALLVTSRLTFAQFLLVDRNLPLGEALSQAWAATAPIKGKVALLVVANAGIAIVGMLALCIGVIPASVVGFLMWASAYRQIFGGAPQAAA